MLLCPPGSESKKEEADNGERGIKILLGLRGKKEVRVSGVREGGEKSRLRMDWMRPEWTGDLVAGQMTHRTTGENEEHTLAWR